MIQARSLSKPHWMVTEGLRVWIVAVVLLLDVPSRAYPEDSLVFAWLTIGSAVMMLAGLFLGPCRLPSVALMGATLAAAAFLPWQGWHSALLLTLAVACVPLAGMECK